MNRRKKRATSKEMPKAYICSPLHGDEKQNINNAIAYAKFVYDRCEKIPIMSHFYALVLDDNDKMQREIGISIGLGQILDSQEVWVFGNTITEGMGEEIRNAMALNREIHYIDDYQCKEILKVYGNNYI